MDQDKTRLRKNGIFLDLFLLDQRHSVPNVHPSAPSPNGAYQSSLRRTGPSDDDAARKVALRLRPSLDSRGPGL